MLKFLLFSPLKILPYAVFFLYRKNTAHGRIFTERTLHRKNTAHGRIFNGENRRNLSIQRMPPHHRTNISKF